MLRARSLVFLTLLLLVLPTISRAGDFLEEYRQVRDAVSLLDLWIQEQMAYQQIPGLAIGIVHDQEVIWAKGYGVEDLESQDPVTPATLFRLGSVTKLFTATAILQLRDQGKLRLDDPVTRHLPGFELRSTFEGAPEITLRHLLTHTAGLPREAAFPYWTTHEFPSTEELIAAVRTQSAIYPPDKTYKYSNLGMALLGEVVVAASGQSYAEYIQQHIFEPLGMNQSVVIPADEDRQRMATAYMRRQADGSRREMEYYETNAMAPAANIVSSVDDMTRFATLHLSAAPESGDGEVVKPSTLHEMQRSHWVYSSWTGGRGLGFGISRRNEKTLVSHGGWIGGNRTHFLLAPDENLAIIAMVNADDASPYLFSYQALDLVGDAITESTAVAPAERRVDPAWQGYLGVYTDPWGWEYQVMILDDGLALYSHNYPPEDDATEGLTRLEPAGGNTFKMSDGELVVFEMNDEGGVERIRRRYDYLYPVAR